MIFNLADGQLARNERGFLNRSLGRDLDAQHCSVGVYELGPGVSGADYHFELTREEWLIVVSGELTLRMFSGERTLRAGDTVAFVSGIESAHQMRNDSEAPARFAMPSTREQSRSVVYPELGQVAVAGPGFFRMLELGGAPVDLPAVHPLSEANLLEVSVEDDADDPDGYRTSYARIGPLVGAKKLGLSVYRIRPGQSICPYHYEIGFDEWLIALTGRPTLRTPEGEQELRAWDVAFFPDGAEGAHKVTNHTDEELRVAMLSNKTDPGAAVYPDSDKVGIFPPNKLFRLGDAVDYWDGEL